MVEGNKFMIVQEDVFDLYNILVNELAGDVWIAIIVGLILVWWMSIKMKMPYELSILFGLLFLAVMFSETFIIILWVFVVLIAGVLFYSAVTKAMEA